MRDIDRESRICTKREAGRTLVVQSDLILDVAEIERSSKKMKEKRKKEMGFVFRLREVQKEVRRMQETANQIELFRSFVKFLAVFSLLTIDDKK